MTAYARGFLDGIALACRLQRRIWRLVRLGRATRAAGGPAAPEPTMTPTQILRPSDRRRTETP